jgi:MoCo/4Fe-4S cofactor protein with predicted Tat translocation signal
MTKSNQYLDLASFSTRLDPERPRQFWRSLDELSHDPALDELLRREFPQPAAPLGEEGVDRRNFLRLMGASFAMAGLAACARPMHKIVPYVNQPENLVPGRPLFYATAMPSADGALGLLVESHEGRPTKVEGNPLHPGSGGATDPFAQAAVLDLYDPDRSTTVRRSGQIATWNQFLAVLQTEVARRREAGGAGISILTETVTSPTLGRQLRRLIELNPAIRWHQWQPVNHAGEREGIRLATGSYATAVYHVDRADVIVSLDANFLSSGAGSVRYARDFAARRRIRGGKGAGNRLYVIESTPTPTGSIADHRFPVRASQIDSVARAIARGVGIGPGGGEVPGWVGAVAADLVQNRGRSLVIAGSQQPAHVHAVAHAINAALGNVGRTISYIDPIEVLPVNEEASLQQLVDDMRGGRVELLVMIHGNPVFTAPADLRFAEALDRVPLRAHLSSHYDETSERSHWHVPATHFLEEWGDARAWDGTVSIVQPLIAPLYNGRSALEVFGTLTDDASDPYEMVRNTWRPAAAGNFDQWWETALHDGVVSGTAHTARGGVVSMAPQLPPLAPPPEGLEIVFRPDPSVWDGRYANNAWLQELPRPLTKITWDNPVMLGPATAARLGVANQDVVEVKHAGASVSLPVWIVPGHPADSVTVTLGYGRTRLGKVGEKVGFDTYPLRISQRPWFSGGVEISRTGRKYKLATTQPHQLMENRDLVRTATAAEYAAKPDFAQTDHYGVKGGPTMYPPFEYPGNAWGMVIDTNVCIGCQGCVVACVSENNIAVAGKEEVLRGREMHWLRIDNYYSGETENPTSYHLPVPCMHCENAPCEPVCPVEATSHSFEGINEMTYNRCVGTRYCSNNCPYKVRRFNFLSYSDYDTDSLKMMRNPDVTVRTRGVMEKCTYCVQRVNAARIEAEKEGRPVRDGEVKTACQQACPTQAIVFGNINDPESEVAKLRNEPSHYGLLVDLNTQPRTTYLATVRNPNPRIEAE